MLDPACGSGTFVAEAVSHFIAAAVAVKWEPEQVLNRLREAVTGIDVHPVAVHLARAAWTLAARPAITAASAAGATPSLSIPVYPGRRPATALRTGDMFAEHNVTVQVEDEENTDLVFPVSLVERAEEFDALMGDVSACIERGDDLSWPWMTTTSTTPLSAQSSATPSPPCNASRSGPQPYLGLLHSQHGATGCALAFKGRRGDRQPSMDQLHQTADVLRTELQNLSRTRYGIWAGGDTPHTRTWRGCLRPQR